MINPLTISLRSGHVVTNDSTGFDTDDRMTPVPVELLVMSDGTVCGYIRYVCRNDYEEAFKLYPWQVCSRIFNTTEYQHVSTFHNFEAALHAAMSVAYRYKSYELNQ